MFGYWKRRALEAERKKQAAYDDYCEVVKERDRLDSAIGWWHEWHDTLRRALGLMYCDTSATLSASRQLIKAHRAQAAIAAIDQAHLRYERRGLEERADVLRQRLADQTHQTQITGDQISDSIRNVLCDKGVVACTCDLYGHPIEQVVATHLSVVLAERDAAVKRADKAEAELARVVAQRERLLEAVEICHATADGICQEPECETPG